MPRRGPVPPSKTGTVGRAPPTWGGGELPPKGVLDHSAQRLTTLAGPAFGGSEYFIGD